MVCAIGANQVCDARSQVCSCRSPRISLDAWEVSAGAAGCGWRDASSLLAPCGPSAAHVKGKLAGPERPWLGGRVRRVDRFSQTTWRRLR